MDQYKKAETSYGSTGRSAGRGPRYAKRRLSIEEFEESAKCCGIAMCSPACRVEESYMTGAAAIEKNDPSC